ncbi:hypothetical protein [Roseisolibacter agri]|uniref:Uracil DNA glycosylase superfamily protein n=1 Tax=Roseisolibacter agri TaxID=2014610 RepID=A0AA37V4C9_9BACT|nr:hypothetical protein [Roseisolibacter agri]GLC27762.1 hypothetical protein rosag_42750 [Roseisolibacter agri]
MTYVHPAERLWRSHAPPTGYPAGVVSVPAPIPGRAFFPGGYGLWGAGADRLPDFPVGGVMVLGHDFHSESGYRESLGLGAERETMPTWRNVRALLCEVGIALERCFFTNLFMGLRAGTATTGVFPGATDADFVAHCRAFLLGQLRAQRPALLLTLGVHVPPIVGTLSPELAPWTEGRGFRHLDAAGPVRTGVTFPRVEGLCTTAVTLVHPSLRHAGVRHRRYAGLAGHAAEVRMLRDAMAAAHLAPDHETA